MPDYKLTYFNTEGRAELTRWCFEYGGIPYIDERIEGSTWAQRKKEIPGGQVPVLFVDGKPLPESIAIARYVAKQAGLVPQDDLQAAHCDALVDALNGLQNDIYMKVIFSKDEPAEKQRVLLEDVVPNKVNPVLTRLNERLASRDWFISDKVTWADLQISLMIGSLTDRVPDMLRNYPHVRKVVDDIRDLKTIKKWIASRPAQ